MEVVLGEGRLGRVYKTLGTSVGVSKEIQLQNCESRNLQDIVQDLYSLRALKHPNIVQCVGVEESCDAVWIKEEFCDGSNLENFMVLKRPSFRRILGIISDCISGLVYLHLHEPVIVHCSLHPRNVLLSRTGSGYTAKLCDISLTYWLNILPSEYGLYFTAPEQLDQSSLGVPTDVFSLGVIIIAMLTFTPADKQLIFLPTIVRLSHFGDSGETSAEVKLKVKQEGLADPDIAHPNRFERKSVILLKDLVNAMTRCRPEDRLTLTQVSEAVDKVKRDLEVKKGKTPETEKVSQLPAHKTTSNETLQTSPTTTKTTPPPRTTTTGTSKTTTPRTAGTTTTPTAAGQETTTPSDQRPRKHSSKRLGYQFRLGDQVVVSPDDPESPADQQAGLSQQPYVDGLGTVSKLDKESVDVIFTDGITKTYSVSTLTPVCHSHAVPSIYLVNLPFKRFDLVETRVTLEELQILHGSNWKPDMEQIVGVQGIVKKANEQYAFVEFCNRKKFNMLVSTLTHRLCPTVSVGDTVLITHSRQSAIKHQDGCGGWVEHMTQSLAKPGLVDEVLPPNRARVTVKTLNQSFIWNIDCLTVIRQH